MTTSEAQARAIAEEVFPLQIGQQLQLRLRISDALRTREAETWEQAIDEVARSLTGSAWHQKRVIDRLRARAAQPQEPEKL